MTRHRTGPCTATRHNTALAYQVDRCACPAAREAHRLYRKRLREGRHQPLRIDGTGTARRLQALSAIGWPPTQLGARLGYDRRVIDGWRQQRRHPLVHRATATAIADLYDELWDTPGPCTRTRRAAARRGWAPPMAWDDHTIDDPHATPDLGSPPRGRIDDADITHLRHCGLNDTQIAHRYGIKVDSLHQALRRRKAS